MLPDPMSDWDTAHPMVRIDHYLVRLGNENVAVVAALLRRMSAPVRQFLYACFLSIDKHVQLCS